MESLRLGLKFGIGSSRRRFEGWTCVRTVVMFQRRMSMTECTVGLAVEWRR